MIQFNLLPDIKLEYIKTARTKRLVTTIAITVTAISLLIMVILLLVVFVFQKKYIRDLSADIAKSSQNLKATPDLDKILTVQNQLNSLTDLHAKKVDATRLLPYVKAVTPAQASIASLNIDFDAQTMAITGAADSLVTVNKFVDTLKFTEYSVGSDKKSAFSEVVLASFGRADKGASYTINLKFDPVIFSNTDKVSLTVPTKVTSRSETEKPTALFEQVTGKAQ